MPRLSLTLLGGFRARLDDDRPLTLSIKKAQALLAYLAIPLGQSHPRDKLAALLWGEMRDPQARGGLRHALFTLRKALGDPSPLRLEGETVALDPALVAVDVQDFERCAASGSESNVEKAGTLYQGELLDGLSLREPPFEEWLIAQRLRLRELALEALARLLAQQRDAGALEPAVQSALQLVNLDPLQEPVHRTLMRLYVELGRREAALRQYQFCVGALQRELRAEPEEETKALYRDILQRRLVRAPAAASARGSAPPAVPADVPTPAEPPVVESPLVGREVELGQLRDALQAAWAGQGQLVAVIGEAGIGKSRLAIELTVEAAGKGGRTLVGRCHESEQVLSFGPWIDALRAGRLAEDDELVSKLRPAWRGELARILPEVGEALSAGPASDPRQLFEAIARLLEHVASLQPVLLILEDVHWADEMSLRLLAFVGRRLQRWRMLAVVTAREEDLPASTMLRHALDELTHEARLSRIPLGPLSREETMALARSLQPANRGADLEPLWRGCEGNPFMIVETVRALRGGPAPESTPGLPLPERIRNLVAHRIERLGDRNLGLVAVAAVIGRPFDFALLQRAADQGEASTAEGVEVLVRHRVLHGTGEGFEFTHDRIREVVDAQLLPARRALLHRRVAEALEALHAGDLAPHALALGTHYREGQVWPRAVLYLAQAGAQASLRHAQRDAILCYEQALGALGHLPESRETREQATDLRCQLGRAFYSMGDFARAMVSFREAEALGLDLNDHERLGQIYGGMAYLLGSEGDFAGATLTGLRALTIATSVGDRALEVWTSIGLSRVYYAQGEYRRGIQSTRRVIDALKDVALDDRFGRASLLPSVACRTWLALCLGRMGEFAEARVWTAESVRIAEAVNGALEQVWSNYCLGRVHLGQGEVDLAIPFLDRAASLCRAGRFPIYSPRVIASLGAAYALSGRLDTALPLLERAVAEAQAMNLLFGHAYVLFLTGAGHLEAGQVAEADRYASSALDLSRRHAGRGDEAWALHLLGEIAARKAPADPERALDRFVEALALAEELGMAPLQARCHLSLGGLHHQAGQVDEARGELSYAIEMLRRMQMRYWLGPAETLFAAC